ncbi:hypothetical protein QTP86_032748 [Hemibagrus guttatus]|nr:hypothetical protein QTP86_032748 [Hemibagrus guttatus]
MAGSTENTEQRLMDSLRTAVQWCKENEHRFLQKVKMPEVLSMQAEEAAYAIKAILNMHKGSEEERDEAVAPFLFHFHTFTDMDFFLSELADRRKLRVFTILKQNTCQTE